MCLRLPQKCLDTQDFRAGNETTVKIVNYRVEPYSASMNGCNLFWRIAPPATCLPPTLPAFPRALQFFWFLSPNCPYTFQAYF